MVARHLAFLTLVATLSYSASLDQQLIGSWTTHGMDSSTTITFERDHTFWVLVWALGEQWIDSTGSWRADARDIVFDGRYRHLTPAEAADFPDRPKRPEHYRSRITKLSHDVLELDRLPYMRTKRPRKPSNQAMQLTAPRSVFPLSVGRTFNLQPRALPGAVADLVSR